MLECSLGRSTATTEVASVIESTKPYNLLLLRKLSTQKHEGMKFVFNSRQAFGYSSQKLEKVSENGSIY